MGYEPSRPAIIRTQGFSCLGFGSLTRRRGSTGRRIGFCGIVSDVR